MNQELWIVIDEMNFNVLGYFETREEAEEYVEKLVEANDESFRDELTITTWTRLNEEPADG